MKEIFNKRLVIPLPSKEHRAFKIYAAQRDKKMSEILRSLICNLIGFGSKSQEKSVSKAIKI